MTNIATKAQHLILLMALILSPLIISKESHASSIAPDIQARLSAPDKIGQVDARFLGLRLYSAALFTEKGTPFRWQRPFALELTYKRSFSRKRLVSASLSELERVEGKQADHKSIETKLNGCFKAVKARDRFVAIPQGKNSVSFLLNGRQTCRINHSNIRKRLLGIWLSDTSRDKQASRRLRGLN
ncbi:MAG: hypothetical protein OIF56_07290 [Cohaesibacter sp.]|nr:hypothetical protein [Cohaesibacter sp.]MCV6601092.1 hypothetical protein [Cohaesibacter sp.]